MNKLSKLVQDLKSYCDHIESYTLAQYADRKWYDYLVTKHTFFWEISQQIKNKTFTAISLTEKLNNLTDDQRKHFFYDSELSRLKQPAVSLDTTAAELIAQIYEVFLNVKLPESFFDSLLISGQNDEEREQEKKDLVKYVRIMTLHLFMNAQEKNAINYLEREIGDPIAKPEKALEVIRGYLEIIQDYFPFYLPKFIEILNKRYPENGDNKKHRDFFVDIMQRILNATDKAENSNAEANKNALFDKHTQLSIVLKHNKIIEEKINIEEINPIISKVSKGERAKEIWNAHMRFFSISKLQFNESPEKKALAIKAAKEKEIFARKVDQVYGLFEKEKALRLIDEYIKLNPGAYKKQFYISLKNRIEVHGLHYSLLLSYLNGRDKSEKLFSRWFRDSTTSRAAILMKQLVGLSMGRELKPDEFNVLAKEEKMPSLDVDALNKRLTLEIEQVHESGSAMHNYGLR